MMLSHFPRSTAKEDDARLFATSTARSDSITQPAEGCADQPFCGADISTSTPVAFISIHAQPEAMQSSTMMPPTA